VPHVDVEKLGNIPDAGGWRHLGRAKAADRFGDWSGRPTPAVASGFIGWPGGWLVLLCGGGGDGGGEMVRLSRAYVVRSITGVCPGSSRR
jgi:hypothetical protein